MWEGSQALAILPIFAPGPSSVLCRDPVIVSGAEICLPVPAFVLQNTDSHMEGKDDRVGKVPKAGMTSGEFG